MIRGQDYWEIEVSWEVIIGGANGGQRFIFGPIGCEGLDTFVARKQ